MKILMTALVVAVSLAGCGCGEPLPPPPPPQPTGTVPESPPPPPPSNDVPGLVGTDPRRAELVHGKDEAQGLAVYGYVIFPERPDRMAGQAWARAITLCRAYQQHLAPVEGPPTAVTFVTYWPLRDASVDLEQDCERVADAYDEQRLEWLRTCLKLESKRGPVLIAQAVPYRAAAQGVPRIVLDLSAVDTPDLTRMIDQWKRFTIDKPGVGYNVLNVLATFITKGSFGASQYQQLAGGCR